MPKLTLISDQPVLRIGSDSTPTEALYFNNSVSCSHRPKCENFFTSFSRDFQPPENACLIVIRDLPKEWRAWVKMHRTKFSRITYFMDDDLPAALNCSELPRDYARKTARRFKEMRRFLRDFVTDWAVSTPELARRYTEHNPAIWPPEYIAPQQQQAPVSYFYHGTSAHRAEMEWLLPIVEKVQSRIPHAWFEIMADTYTRKLYRHVPRVRMLHPMSWPDFLDYTSNFSQNVGLAPLLPSYFNLARSHVKFFDITRTGAAGIYSNIGPYPDHIKDGETGMLLPNDPDQWVEAIIHLLTNPAERERLLTNALQVCKKTLGESDGE